MREGVLLLSGSSSRSSNLGQVQILEKINNYSGYWVLSSPLTPPISLSDSAAPSSFCSLTWLCLSRFQLLTICTSPSPAKTPFLLPICLSLSLFPLSYCYLLSLSLRVFRSSHHISLILLSLSPTCSTSWLIYHHSSSPPHLFHLSIFTDLIALSLH